MGEPSNRLLFGFHSIIAVSGPPIWNLFGSIQGFLPTAVREALVSPNHGKENIQCPFFGNLFSKVEPIFCVAKQK